MNAIFLKRHDHIVGLITGKDNCIRFLECKSYKEFISKINKYEKDIEYGRTINKYNKPEGKIDLYYTAIVFDEILIADGEVNKYLVLSKNPNAKEINVWRICDY